jgi:hypothetical protein
MEQPAKTTGELLALMREKLARGEPAAAKITVKEPCPHCGVNPTVVLMVLMPGEMESRCTACRGLIPTGCKSKETHNRDGTAKGE